MAPIGRTFSLENEANGLGLNCTAEGLSLAGVPLLRKAISGFTPRPPHEIAALMAEAYGGGVNPSHLSSGLELISRSLDRGDIGRAMIAALQLRLPALDAQSSIRITEANENLAKFDDSEPRDSHGRWVSDGGAQPAGSTGSAAVRARRRSAQASHRSTRSTPRQVSGQSSRDPRLIPISMSGAANDNLAERVCISASRHCQISALQDKARTPYFAACQKAEDVCLMALSVSRFKPDQQLNIVFPDHTVVMIEDGNAAVTHVGGVRLKIPIH